MLSPCLRSQARLRQSTLTSVAVNAQLSRHLRICRTLLQHYACCKQYLIFASGCCYNPSGWVEPRLAVAPTDSLNVRLGAHRCLSAHESWKLRMLVNKLSLMAVSMSSSSCAVQTGGQPIQRWQMTRSAWATTQHCTRIFRHW